MTQDRYDGSGSGEADLSPVIDSDPLNLVTSLTSIIHYADSEIKRRHVMAAIDFPFDDIPMFLVLNQLTYAGAMRPSDLALMLGYGRANLTKIAHRLVEAGLVVRVADSADARSVLLALSPQGRELGRRIIAVNENFLSDLLFDWSDEEVLTLKRML